MGTTPPNTALRAVKALAVELLGEWDGKNCIEFLRKHNYNWKQMEWIGWYFEFRAKQILKDALGGGPGPSIGNVVIDFAIAGEPWDFKAHPSKRNDGWIYLNDVEAVDTCAAHLGGIGWIIAVGEAAYDTDGSFKAWHAELKGGESAYEAERKRRGAASRKRKTSFRCTHFLVAKVASADQIKAATDAGLLKANMQAGQRNADGKPRRSKYGIHMSRASAGVGGEHMVVFRYPPASE